MQIQFFEEDIKYPTTFRRKNMRSILLEIIRLESSKSIDYINFVLCSDDYLLQVNIDFLEHDYFTDIITFDYSETEISSDIFISKDRIFDNARKNSVTLLSELHRVIIHGVLHLVGYKDKTDEEQTIMTSKENYYLDLMYKNYASSV